MAVKTGIPCIFKTWILACAGMTVKGSEKYFWKPVKQKSPQ
jgi:hypothetical protein